MTGERLLTTDEVARRLGVKRATVYAYVSRGLLENQRNADGKESLFTEPAVEAFAATRRKAGPGPDASATHTGITLITGGDLFYRGHDVPTLAGTEPFESVASLLWTGELHYVALTPDPALRLLGQAVTAPLPPSARLTDRLRLIVAAAAAADPLRFDTSPSAVVTTARTMLATMVAALPLRTPDQPPPSVTAVSPAPGVTALSPAPGVMTVPPAPGVTALSPAPGVMAAPTVFPLAESLWHRLTDNPPSVTGIATLNAALVLLADHDLAASTLAARVAASTRAHPYAVVGAGLAALDGPLHGAASGLAYRMLSDAVRSGDPVATVSDRLRAGAEAPGFGHPLYPGGDPRATALMELQSYRLARGKPAEDAAVVAELATAMTQRSGVAPNVDFALAAFALLNGMDADAGEAIFAVARTAGWIAHALEEYSDRPSRFRPNGRYAGRFPGGGQG